MLVLVLKHLADLVCFVKEVYGKRLESCVCVGIIKEKSKNQLHSQENMFQDVLETLVQGLV